MFNIDENLKKVHQEIIASSRLSKRSANDITLLCVSKTKPESLIKEAYLLGERHFGESYAVEAAEKIQSLKSAGYHDIIWHFIGPIQKNKTKLIAENFDIVESLDRPILAKRLNEQRPENLKPLKVLIQVNISDEPQKSGCDPKDLKVLADYVKTCPKLELCGLMGIALDTPHQEIIEAQFAKLQTLFLKFQPYFGSSPILSMGMTHDLNLAIRQGSTEVRIGTAIFGAREYKKGLSHMKTAKIAFIGGGNMSSCIFSAIVKSQNGDASNITVSGPHLDKLEKFKSQGALITDDNVLAVNHAEVIFLGVKPQILSSVLEQLKNADIDFSKKLVISMAAGFKLDSIFNKINSHRVIRIMPNTPAKIGLGVIAVAYGHSVDDEDKDLCKKLLANMGSCIEGREQDLNVIGVICGCGPAFVYRFMEALISQSVKHGINEATARGMVEQTLLGTARLSKTNEDTPISSLREAVTSKGGTTFAGLQAMNSGGFDDLIEKTVKASLERTYEFEKMF